jgi:predicted transcriptional regulator
MTDKQLVLDTVHKLPDDTPLEKISEEIVFLVAVQQGLKALDEGRVVSHEDVKALDEGRVVSHEDVKARVASWAHRGRK